MKVRRRFPTIEHVRDSGMMTEEEYGFYKVKYFLLIIFLYIFLYYFNFL